MNDEQFILKNAFNEETRKSYWKIYRVTKEETLEFWGDAPLSIFNPDTVGEYHEKENE